MSDDRKRKPPASLDMPFAEALTRFAQVNPAEMPGTPQAKKGTRAMEPSQRELELVQYETPDCKASFTLDPSNETVWATQQQIADAFGVAENTVTGHLKNIFREGELDEAAVARKIRARGKDGKVYNLLHYSLDAILSVGYRVSSKRATAFRRWANEVLKDYLVQGFALNEARLRDDPRALRELAAKVRAVRADEKNIYRGVRDTFAFGSMDYDAKAEAARKFFARLQEKFLYAATGKTASQIILDRADGSEPNMGLQTMKGERPSSADIHTGKNYLNENELYSLHILCEQFLLFVEFRALRGSGLTMKDMNEKFDELLKVQGVPIFRDYADYLKDRAKAHAERELAIYRRRLTHNPSPAE